MTVHQPVVSPSEWQAARDALLAEEKEATRARDALAAERRRLPMVRIDKDYVFDGPDGKASLLDLFEGRRQLIALPLHVRAEPGRGLRRLLDVRRPDRPPRAPARARHVVRARLARPDREDRGLPGSGWAGRSRGTRRSGATSTSTSASGRRCRSRTSTRTARRSASASSCATATTSFAPTSRRSRGVEALGSVWTFLDLTPLGRQEELGGLARRVPADAAVPVVAPPRRIRASR